MTDRCALAMYGADIGLGIESPFITVEQDLGSRAQRFVIRHISWYPGAVCVCSLGFQSNLASATTSAMDWMDAERDDCWYVLRRGDGTRTYSDANAVKHRDD